MRLISDLKTFLVIHDFPAINETIKKQTDDLQKSVSHEYLSVFLWNVWNGSNLKGQRSQYILDERYERKFVENSRGVGRAFSTRRGRILQFAEASRFSGLL